MLLWYRINHVHYIASLLYKHYSYMGIRVFSNKKSRFGKFSLVVTLAKNFIEQLRSIQEYLYQI